MSANTIQWFLHSGVEQTGPFTAQQIQAGLQRGEILEHHFVWRAGLSGWAKISECDEIRAPMASPQNMMIPPPLLPQQKKEAKAEPIPAPKAKLSHAGPAQEDLSIFIDFAKKSRLHKKGA